MNIVSKKVIVATAFMSALFALACIAIPSKTNAAEPNGQIMFILDASSSMFAKDGGSTTRFDRAKESLSRALDSIPSDIPIGLRVYGSTVSESDQVAGCQDTKLITAPKANNARSIKSSLANIQPKGWTLMGKALETAQSDFTSEGPKTIILISDGIDTCVEPRACDVAANLAKSGTSIKINSVGLVVDDGARNELKCIADAGQGSYYDIANTNELEKTLKDLAKREVELFQAKGTPIKGTLRVEESPLLAPNWRYTDAISIPQQLFYSFELEKGQKLTVIVKGLENDQDLGSTDYLKMRFYDFDTESAMSIGGWKGPSGQGRFGAGDTSVATISYTFDADKMNVTSKKRFAFGLSITESGNGGKVVPIEIVTKLEDNARSTANTSSASANNSGRKNSTLLTVLVSVLGTVLFLALVAASVWFVKKRRTRTITGNNSTMEPGSSIAQPGDSNNNQTPPQAL